MCHNKILVKINKWLERSVILLKKTMYNFHIYIWSQEYSNIKCCEKKLEILTVQHLILTTT